jgi:hypothetical protein
VRFEGTPVYLNERQLSGAADNDLNVADGREAAVTGTGPAVEPPSA